MSELTILIGIPNSGKSTYAKKLANKNTVILDCDCKFQIAYVSKCWKYLTKGDETKCVQ